MFGFNLLKKSFSNDLDKVGRGEIGLYEVTSFGGLPGLAIIITSDTYFPEGWDITAMKTSIQDVA